MSSILIIYDGECPLCRSYVRMQRLKAMEQSVELINARASCVIVDELREKGFDLNDGMVIKMGENIYHGSDAIRCLAMLSSRSTLLGRTLHWIFGSKRRAAILYPLMRTGRKILLMLLRRPMIDGA